MRAKTTSQPLLSASLSTRLSRYSTAAAVGAVTLSGSQAAIVYINYGNLLIADAVPNDGLRQTIDFDIDQNGTVDLRWRQGIETIVGQNFAGFRGPPGGTVGTLGVITGAGFLYPARLAASAIIGPSAGFITIAATGNPASMASGSGFPQSRWAGGSPANTGYLGVRFTIGANQHYGWIRLTVNENAHPTRPRAMTIHEGAFEDVPDTEIAAGAGAIPEPTSLGLLALGSIGLTAHRRRPTAAC